MSGNAATIRPALDPGRRRVRARTRAKISIVLWLTPVLVAGTFWLLSSGSQGWNGIGVLVILTLSPFLFLPFSMVGLVFALSAIRGSERPLLWILGATLNGLSLAAAAAVLLTLLFS